ncbi:cytochrome P450 [Epithele typhae]|uniref:cytochrome P450 n=1 Tax=Epithele typhae TaxID=378194 RepID=UPI00200889BF|nr:cytochrome P450 [Epithele typhae]KAH9921182.1 cytochrome P450 [Epithele typhae]
MALFDGSVGQTALYAVAACAAFLVFRKVTTRSPLDNVPGPAPDSWLRGNLGRLFVRQPWAYRREMNQRYGHVWAVPGLAGSKWLSVSDPKAMHAIFIKDIDIYEEPSEALMLMLGPGLLSVKGTQHKRQRKMLNPVFSTKHLRDMMPLFFSVVHKTRDAITSRVEAADGSAPELDVLGWMGRTTLEVLGQAGLGYSFDPLTSDRPDAFANAVKDFFPELAKTFVGRLILPYTEWMGSKQFKRKLVELLGTRIGTVRRLAEIADVMHARSVEIFKEKGAALSRGDEALKQQVGEGKDVMSILLRANMLASEEDRLPDDELIAQVSTMILAGMDTTANTLARILELLAQHPDVQESLREEITRASEQHGDDEISFDDLMALPLLEAVCRETFRVSPGVTALFRQTATDVVMPLTTPIRMRDGTLADAVPIPAKTRLIIDNLASNCDPATWGPDAHVWRPERWLAPVPAAVEAARIPGVYSHLMTFIGGSKSCIGFKFAQLEAKVVLYALLQRFRFESTALPVQWNMAGVQYPSVGDGEPCMPLKVSLLRGRK